MKTICSFKAFRTVQHTEVSNKLREDFEAFREEKKFLNYLGSSKWAEGMETIRKHILQTTTLDKEITSNQGNQFVIVDSIRAALQRVDPALLDARYGALK